MSEQREIRRVPVSCDERSTLPVQHCSSQRSVVSSVIQEWNKLYEKLGGQKKFAAAPTIPVCPPPIYWGHMPFLSSS